MKKISKRKVLFLFAVTVLSALTITGCGKKKTETAATEPSVTCVDDLEGKKIGVQLGTTGDVYVSDYEGDDAGTVIERYNKGNDAVQRRAEGRGKDRGRGGRCGVLSGERRGVRL